MADGYDDIVVGAGSSGAVLAARLSEDPDRSVLVLEAGPDYPRFDQIPEDVLHIYSGTNSSWQGHDWGLTARATLDREIVYPRGKIVGGSSAVNGAVALRGVPADYDRWALLGNDRWGWPEVLPYFKRLEADQDEGAPYHGNAGPIPIGRFSRANLTPISRAFLEASAELGFPYSRDFNHPEATGAGVWPLNQKDGIRISTAIGYLPPARHRPNLTIRPGCLADRVIFAGNRAIGVEAICDGRQPFYGQRITLSAGAIGSPTILMRSGIGPRDDLQRLGIEPRVDLPGVGANLIDHPRCHVFFKPSAAVRELDSSVFEAGIRYTAPASHEPNDMQLCLFAPLDAKVWHLPVAADEEIQANVFAALQRPLSRGQLSLTSSDPDVPPMIDLNYLDHVEDVRRVVEGVRIIWRLLKTAPMSPYVERILPNPLNRVVPDDKLIASDEALKTYVRQTVTTIFHPVGTARIGPESDEMAVVDQYCQVRGVDNLLVVDASIMPDIPRANTNLTCIMIGERVAEWMKGHSR